MADATEIIMPPLRCSHVATISPRGIVCGARAVRYREGSNEYGPTFVCEAHACETDVPIAGEHAIRVVRLQVEIVFAGVVTVPGAAQLEAVEQLHHAVNAVGGLVNLIGVGSRLVRWMAPASAGEPKGYLGDHR